MRKAFIFDMDGVLVDSESLHYEADSEVFRRLNIQVSAEDRLTFLGKGTEAVLSFLKEKYNLPQETAELVMFDNQVRLDYFRKHTLPPVPGIHALLRDIKSAGYPIAVASSSVKPLVQYLLESNQLAVFFTAIACGDEVKKTKPDPSLYLLAARRMGIDPADCVAVEDSPNGLYAAKAAGMPCILYAPLPAAHNRILPADKCIISFVGLRVEDLI